MRAMMRKSVTVFGFAAATAAATLAVCWPCRTYADPPETFFESGEVDDITFSGEIARDAAMKSGWAMKVTYENRGDEEGHCQIDSELMRAQVNPGSRASPPGVAVWHHKDKVTVAAHESVVKSYEVPAWMAVQLGANEKASEARQKMVDRENEKPNPNYAISMRPYTMYSVAFVKADG
jgi:hypothetical protein